MLLPRKTLNHLLDEVCAKGVQLILICNDTELPASINRFAEIKEGQLVEVESRELISAPPERERRELPDFFKAAAGLLVGYHCQNA